MYSLEMLLVAWGILVFQRALEKPTTAASRRSRSLVALLLYTQYWAFYLLLVVGVLLLALARVARRVPPGGAARCSSRWRSAALAFVPWLPTFLYQRAHTGTPWGTPRAARHPDRLHAARLRGRRERDGRRSQEGWLLFFILLPMLSSACSPARPTSAGSRSTCTSAGQHAWEAFVGGVGLVVALTLNYLAGGAFQSRYSAIVFPFFVLLVARGFTTLRDPAHARRRARGGDRVSVSRAGCAT